MPNKKIKVNIKIRFQEILALTVVIPFLAFTILVLLGERPLTVIQIYVPLISIILGGYFGQGAIREWRSRTESSELSLIEYGPDVDQQYESQQQETATTRPPI